MDNFNLTKPEALKAAIRRLPLTHPDRAYLEKELHNTEAGIRGEKRLRKKFIEYYSNEPFEIIWDVNLTLGNWPVQIDGLLLTQQTAIILESKNISGELYFDKNTEEFYRIDRLGITTVMDNPAIQVEKHIRFLQAWLNNFSIELPIEGLLVFTAKHSELKSLPTNIPACRLHHMIEKVFKIKKAHRNSLYSKKSLNNIRQLIDENQTPYKPKTISLHYSIDEKEFNRGIYCNECNAPTVERAHYKWHCKQCGIKNDSALFEAVREYFALIGGPVTNEKIREFTGIKDRHIVKRLMTSYQFHSEGKTKDRKYFIGK